MRTLPAIRPPRLLALCAAACALLAAWGALATPALAAPPPTLSAASPATGPLAGGTLVTLTGTGFDGGATVDFGGIAGVGVTVVSATSITVTTPAHTPGEVVVTVTNGDGQSTTLSGGFRFLGPPPTLTSVDPATGGTNGGTTVTLTGTDFLAGASVTIGGRAATGVTRVNATTTTAVTPWGVVGAADIVYTAADGQSATLPAAFTYTQSAPPAVTSVSPGGGSHGGGTPVTITGTGFANGAIVRFGATAATAVQFVNATTITATAPGGSAGTTVGVTVVNPDAQTGTRASAFAYVDLPAPTVTAVSPAAGPLAGGTSVTVTGTNFNPGAVVRFGALAGTTVSVTPTTIVVTAPPQTATGKVEVRVTNTDTKTAALAAAYTYQAAPTVTAVKPETGSTAGGTAITLTGTGFQAGMTVRIGGVPATEVKVSGATSATAVTPEGVAGLATVSVTNADGQSAVLATGGFTYVLAPAVSAVSPVSGTQEGGTAVVITGTGFATGVTVSIGGKAATNVVVVDATRITAVTPAGTPGAAAIVVTTAGGIASAGGTSFVYASSTGSFTAGSIPTTGFGLVVFSGGTTAMLVQAAQASGCTDLDRVAFFAADGKGAFVSYLASAPPFVNGQWLAMFPAMIPANQPLLVRCG